MRMQASFCTDKRGQNAPQHDSPAVWPPLAVIPCAAIRLYQRFVSPLFPPKCRFYPSCSEYALQSLSRYGLRRGMCLAVKRLARCGPWCAGGYDPVPQSS